MLAARSWLAGERLTRWFLAAILTFGVLIRLVQYLARRSLWLDEASLALNFFDRGFAKLLLPLEKNQSAPLGFNAATELVVQIAGLSEWSLRFLPFLGGLAALFCFWRLSRRWLSGGALLFTNYSFAISAMLIYYSNEFKPYILDVLLSIAVSWAVLVWWEDGAPRRRLPWIAALGVLGICFSFPVIFVLAGVGVVVSFACWRERRYPQLAGLIAVAAIWLVTFGGLYLLSTRQIASMDGLTAYWRQTGAFMPLPPWKPASLRWLVTNFFNYFHDVAGLHHSRNIFQFIFLVGVIELVRRRATIRLCALLAPILLAVLASALERYPFQIRLALFTVPMALLICGEGMRCLLTRLRHPALQIALVGMALFSPTVYSLPQLWHPLEAEEVRPLAEYLQREAKAQDVVLVFRDNSSFAFYARSLGLPLTAIPFDPEGLPSVWPQIAAGMQLNRHHWLVISHFTDAERDAVLAELRSRCRVRLVSEQIGAQLFALEPLSSSE
jgi:uncharacterized membrane protein